MSVFIKLVHMTDLRSSVFKLNNMTLSMNNSNQYSHSQYKLRTVILESNYSPVRLLIYYDRNKRKTSIAVN